jgi:probable F420-dependent oxidoreductase
MEVGFTSMNTLEDLDPGLLGRALEERGFRSLWIGEHSHIPVSRRTPYPAGGEMPVAYRSMMDPLLSLLAAARATTTLRVGTGVALPLEHDVFALAKAVATLDHLSDGRVDLGVGVGWNVEELADHRPDIAWPSRYQALEECVSALRALWTQDEAEFHGRWYDFDAVWADPKPLQRPHPPILCGMAGPKGTEHALRWADGWMPMDIALGNVARRLERFAQAAVDAGRAPVSVTMVTWGDPTPETLFEYRELGIERVVIGAARSGWDDPATTLSFLDRYADLAVDLADGAP